MKTPLRIYPWEGFIHLEILNRAVKLMFVLLLITGASSVFAQDKVVSQQEWQLKLDAVNENIDGIDQLTTAINQRIEGIPPENIDPTVTVRLNDLQIQRDQYAREKISIQAMIHSVQNFSAPVEITEIPESTFLSLPLQNQEQILAHPERYKVIQSK